MIIKTRKNSDYTVISNHALRDKSLSLKAKGLWAFIMAKPKEWNVNGRGLAAELQESRPTINRVLKELEDAGYLKRGQVTNKDGKFTQGENILYETPWTKNVSTESLSTYKTLSKVSTTKVVEAGASTIPESPISFGASKTNTAAADAAAPTAAKLLYDVCKKHDLVITNHNHIRKWAKDLELHDPENIYLKRLLAFNWNGTDGEFKPTINTPYDIVAKKTKIERFLNGGQDKPAYDPRVFGDF